MVRWPILAAWLSGAWLAPAAALEVAARDASTGAAVAARVTLVREGDATSSTVSPWLLEGRRHDFALPVGRWRFRADADGYRPLEGVFEQDAIESTLPATLLLDPQADAAAFADVDARTAADPSASWLHGFVRDARDGSPLAGARVQALGHESRSDANGYFALQLDAAVVTDEAPVEFALRVQASGFPEWERTRVLRTPGAQRWVIALGGDVPPRAVQELGVRDRAGTVGESGDGNRFSDAAAQPAAISALPPALSPPPSIRVGFADASCTTSCCTASCTNTCTVSLETYVARGLDNEWIPSWNTQSLRAGSIAYRSYGAWRVANPIRAAFDICSSACCQVNDNTASSSAVSNAVARTPGLLLTRTGTSAFGAEYSAENNGWDDPGDGLSCSATVPLCGNGLVGDASLGWPCMVDDVAAGHGCFGHGRGMSQWGTQRWAIGSTGTTRTWPWIVNHYFNDNGNATGAGSGNRTAVMTSPLTLAALSARPTAPAPGETIRLGALAHNAAGAVHSHILVGASLYRSGGGYLDDSAHDAPASLAAGTDTVVARDFLVPVAATAGRYDLLVSLYLDVDENGAIAAGDLALALVTLPGAVEVVTDRLFADGFGY